MIEPVEIAGRDGTVIRGLLHVGGDDGVLLVHEPGKDLDAWGPLPHALAAYRLAVLAIDLAGHGGSQGTPDPDRTAEDVVAAGRALRQRASGSLFVGAAGASAGPALEAADELGARGFFALDPMLEAPPHLPTLVILPSGDERQTVAAQLLRGAGARVVAAHLPVRAEGLELLASDWAENVQGYIATFVNDLRLAVPDRDAAWAGR